MLTEKEIKQVHPEYSDMAPEWDYYWRSYIGGNEYREGAYLRKYLNEDAAPGDQYGQRLLNTALQNHVKSIVHIYRSYLFRTAPTRVLSNLLALQDVNSFMVDVDLKGTDLNAFMKKIQDSLMVYGSMWLIVDRPAYRTLTRAEELQMGIRAYVNAYVPGNVLDWEYTPTITGKQELTFLKLIEHSGDEYDQIVVWKPEVVERYWVEKKGFKQKIVAKGSIGAYEYAYNDEIEYGKILRAEEYLNPLGYVPAFRVSTDDGHSQIADIADTQRQIYNRLSELEQSIRISGHPTLVKTADTQAAAGAGAVITVPEDLPADKNPYLLQPSGATIQSILDSIQMDVDAIDKMAHVSGIRGSVGSPMSGVALQTEMQMLNSRLSDFAEILQEAEYKIWELFTQWQGIQPDGDFAVEYEKSFDIRDKHSDLELLRKANEFVSVPELGKEIQRQVAKLLIEDEQTLDQVLTAIDQPVLEQHATQTPETVLEHIDQMIAEGYTDEQILEMHPEIASTVIARLRNQ